MLNTLYGWRFLESERKNVILGGGGGGCWDDGGGRERKKYKNFQSLALIIIVFSWSLNSLHVLVCIPHNTICLSIYDLERYIVHREARITTEELIIIIVMIKEKEVVEPNAL